MRTRQYHQGRLIIIKSTEPSTKQTDKQAIMATEQANITEAVVQVVAQATSLASTDSNQRAQNVGPKLGGPMMKQLTFS